MVALSRIRPTGVTVLVILEVLAGTASLLGGLALFVLPALGGRFGVPYGSAFPSIFSAFLGVFGGLLVLIGIVQFVIAYGYLNGMGWAWTVGLVLAGIGALTGLSSLFSGGVISLILNGLIIYYLPQPHVKELFGRSPGEFVIPIGRVRVRCPRCRTLNKRSPSSAATAANGWCRQRDKRKRRTT